MDSCLVIVDDFLTRLNVRKKVDTSCDEMPIVHPQPAPALLRLMKDSVEIEASTAKGLRSYDPG